MLDEIKSWEELEATVLRIGFLPYFKNKIPGFSVEEHVPEILLWDITEGPWDWKGSVLRNLRVAYGKFFNRRAGYISLESLPDFLNIRRKAFPLHKGTEEYAVYSLLRKNESLLSSEWRKLASYSGRKSTRLSANPFENMPSVESSIPNPKSDSRFESIVTRLQMAGYITIADFEYLYDRKGDRYGWGLARYTTPEALYGIKPASRPVNRSAELLFKRLPFSSDSDISSLIHKLICG